MDRRGYQKYVFDPQQRVLVGDFDKMYSSEDTEGYDSWFERDLRFLRKRIGLELLNGYTFKRILDIGCGKGTFTQFLKKANNEVVAIDVSPAALGKARRSFPDIDFRCLTAEQIGEIGGGRFDLAVVMGTFSYVEKWKSVLEQLSAIADRCFVEEWLPQDQDPIGAVKSFSELTETFQLHFDLEHKILIDDSTIALMGATKNRK